MQHYSERGIECTFPDTWEVIKYECSAIHLSCMMPLQNTKAADFICNNGNSVMLIEIKHYNEHPIASIFYLIDEIVQQFRDTLCGIAVNRMLGGNELRSFSDILFTTSPVSESPLCVVLLEISKENATLPAQEIRQIVSEQLKKRFAPWNIRVFVLNAAITQSGQSPWKARVL